MALLETSELVTVDHEGNPLPMTVAVPVHVSRKSQT
jgi:hypothetical protein